MFCCPQVRRGAVGRSCTCGDAALSLPHCLTLRRLAHFTICAPFFTSTESSYSVGRGQGAGERERSQQKRRKGWEEVVRGWSMLVKEGKIKKKWERGRKRWEWSQQKEKIVPQMEKKSTRNVTKMLETHKWRKRGDGKKLYINSQAQTEVMEVGRQIRHYLWFKSSKNMILMGLI